MIPAPFLRLVPLGAMLLLACSDGGPTAPADGDAFEGEAPLAAVLPDLAPEPGTAGTDRYVPTLERILRRGIGVIQERQGEEAAQRVMGEARSLREAIQVAREAGDAAAVQEAVRKLDAFSARVGLRVFGVRLVRHVHGDAAAKLQALRPRLKEAAEAGEDVSRFVVGAQQAKRMLDAAKSAAQKGQPLGALIHAAHALDLVTRIGAAL